MEVTLEKETKETKKIVAYVGHGRIDRFAGGDHNQESEQKLIMVLVVDFMETDKELKLSPFVQKSVMGVLDAGWKSHLSDIIIDKENISFKRHYDAQKTGDNQECPYVEEYSLINSGGNWIGSFKTLSGNCFDRGVIWFHLMPVHEGEETSLSIEGLFPEFIKQTTWA